MTIQDIAKLAGVSKSTVSRVLNDAQNVNPQTREQVQRVIRENNYAPSAMAQGLPRQTSNVIGVVVPEMDNAFFGKIIMGIETQLEELQLNLNILVSHTHNDPVKEQKALQMLKQQRVQGLILTTSIEYAQKQDYLAMRKLVDDFMAPIVLVDRQIENARMDGVYFDNFNAAYTATQAMIESGNKRIGCIIADQKLKLGRDRWAGFLHAMGDYEMTIDERFFFRDDYPITIEKAYQITRQMIEENKLPDAILLSNNLIGDGFLKAIFEAGLKLGEDICCVGLDRSVVSDIFNLNYTFVDKTPEWMGQVAVKLLAERLKTSGMSTREEVQHGKLCRRGSEMRKKL